jgi:CheY-like chemotaxis protein
MEPSGSPERPILVVEDSDDLRATLRDLLEDEGYAVLTAANGIEALEVLAAGVRPGIILLDLMMPVMDGWEVLAAMQEDAELATLPVLSLSASREPGPTAPNVRGSLSKPMATEALLAEIRRCYERS